MDRALIELIAETVGVRRNYTWNDIYMCLDKLVTLMSETAQDEE